MFLCQSWKDCNEEGKEEKELCMQERTNPLHLSENTFYESPPSFFVSSLKKFPFFPSPTPSAAAAATVAASLTEKSDCRNYTVVKVAEEGGKKAKSRLIFCRPLPIPATYLIWGGGGRGK